MTDMDVRAKFGSRAMMGALDAADPVAQPRVALSEAAAEIARHFSAKAIAGSMVSGLVRLFEFFAILAIGFGFYYSQIVPVDGFDARYLIPLFAGSLFTVIFVQAADGLSTSGASRGRADRHRPAPSYC